MGAQLHVEAPQKIASTFCVTDLSQWFHLPFAAMVLPVWKSHISNDFVDHSIPLSKCQRSAWSGKPRCWGQRITVHFTNCKSHLRFSLGNLEKHQTSNTQSARFPHFTREIGVRKQTPSFSAFEPRCIALSHNALQASCMLHQPSPNQLPSVGGVNWNSEFWSWEGSFLPLKPN